MDYIDQHLDAPLVLDDLAAVANFSSFHFHRVFSAWIGETLGDYLQRRRIEVAAMRIAARSNESILSIALSVGFGSGEAFARAFKRRFSCTPTAWRTQTPQRWAAELALTRDRNAQHQRQLLQSNPDQALELEFSHSKHSPALIGESQMNVRLIDMATTRIAYMRSTGLHGVAVADFWLTVFKPWMAAHGLDGQPCYGIIHDDPTITPAAQCRYDYCVDVPEGFLATGKATVATLMGGRYAVARFTGTAAMISHAWTEMFREWLPASGMQCDARPFFNRYPSDICPDPQSGVFACELFLPVVPL